MDMRASHDDTLDVDPSRKVKTKFICGEEGKKENDEDDEEFSYNDDVGGESIKVGPSFIKDAL